MFRRHPKTPTPPPAALDTVSEEAKAIHQTPNDPPKIEEAKKEAPPLAPPFTPSPPSATMDRRSGENMSESFAAATTPTPATESNSSRASERAYTEREGLARDIKEGNLSGFIGNTTEMHGDTSFVGMLRVDGKVYGTVKSDKGTLILSSGGLIEANVEVGVAKILGTVRGNINCTEKIEIGRTGHVIGDILTPSLVIEQGAVFEGACKMNKAPKTALPSTQKSEQAKPAPAKATAVAPVSSKANDDDEDLFGIK